MLHFKLKIRQKSFVGRVPPGHDGELTALPKSTSWIKGKAREGKGKDRRKGDKRKERREGKGEGGDG